MATFKEQVQGITNLTIDGTGANAGPSKDELLSFILDGINDVVTKWLLVNPQDALLFARESSEYTANGVELPTGKVISVIRESGTNDDWRMCRLVPHALAERVKDSTSIHYASKYNPAYYVGGLRQLSILPVPDTGGADSWKMVYVEYNSNTDTDDNELTVDSDSIKYFPKKLYNLVVKYAALKCFEAKIAEYSVIEEDSELVSSLANSYNALKAEYDQIYGLAAKSAMKTGTGAGAEEVPEQQEVEEEE